MAHPFQMQEEQLVDMLNRHVDLEPLDWEPVQARSFLPSVGDSPTPSLELQDDLECEIPAPEHWQAWSLNAVSVGEPDILLSGMHTLPNSPGMSFGSDLLFWHGLSDRLNDAIRRHEYLPAVIPDMESSIFGNNSSKEKRTGKKAPEIVFRTGWELTDHVSDSIVRSFSTVIPGVCRALSLPSGKAGGVRVQTRPLMMDAEELVRNFLNLELNRRIRSIRLPNSIRNLFQDPFPANALPEPDPFQGRYDHSRVLGEPVTRPAWEQWYRWRNQINRAKAEVDVQICFRLTDPEPDRPDAWHLEWLLSAHRDPSHQIPLTEFWESNPDARHIREVLLQLGQAARLYPRLWDGMDSSAPDSVVLMREEALDFLYRDAAVLQGAGFRVIVPSWWTVSGRRRLRLQMRARTPDRQKGSGSESSGLLGMDAAVAWEPSVVLDGIALTREEWEEIVRAKQGLIQMRGQWMELKQEDIALLEENSPEDGILRETTMRDLLRSAGDPHLEIVYDGQLAKSMEDFGESGSVTLLPQPEALSGKLRSYQQRGFSWLTGLEELGFGACLADDMGLGKTIQVLATLLHDRVQNPDAGPTMLVAPTSVLGNWQSEARTFAPSLKTCIHHGNSRPRTLSEMLQSTKGMDLVIMSFGVARLDKAMLAKVPWQRLVVDEAQNVKNPTAAITKALAAIPTGRRIALTGTPVENRLLDLWSIFNIINPGFLGSVTGFRKDFERPIMREGNRAAMIRLKEMVRPFILRRLKSDRSIISDLPDKIEQNAHCSLTAEQATLYESVLRDVDRKLKSEKGIERQGIMLSTLMRLKQICNHPVQFLQDGSEFSDTRSHKLARVCEMLEEIHAERESALIFTQFTDIGKSLQSLIRARLGCTVHYLHGGTPMGMRQHMVDSFQDPESEPSVFVLSLRAAGVGLTLTQANHVIHFDRWWNPAVENQATDRAYRIGQKKIVMVHKMVTLGTMEEKIDQLIESKKKLAQEVVGEGESWLSDMGNDEFRALISLDRENAVVT